MWKKAVSLLLALLLMPMVPVAADAMPESGGVIYLTFDDGPGPGTEALLELLKRYGAKATFFLVNTGYEMDRLLPAMAAAGHSIGIHSYSHDFAAIYSSEEAFMEDLYAMQALIRDKIGETPMLLRFPGGSSNTVSRHYCAGIMTKLTRRVTEAGFVYFDWNVDSGDAYGCDDPEQISRNVISGIRGRERAVVLQHDLNACSIRAVERILRWGSRNGYRFLPLTEQSPTCHHRVQN